MTFCLQTSKIRASSIFIKDIRKGAFKLMAVQQVTPVTCPSCKAQFTAPIQTVIDGQDMQTKIAFLQGQLNFVQCPQCGFAGAPSTPTFYYDMEKELAMVFVPTDMSLAGADQEKIIGDLTNKVVNSLPTEQRKFFLLSPKRFLSLESLVKAVLEADGITEEVIQAQEAKGKLMEKFMSAPDETALKALVKEHDDELDREFFEMFTAYIQTAQLSGDQQSAQALLSLRTLISRWSSQGKQIVAEIDKEVGIVVMESQEELLEKLLTANNDEEFEALVNAGHAFLDYGFFQQLTAKIDQATKNGDTQTAESLTEVRTKVLDVKAKQEEQTKEVLENAANLLQKIIQSGDPERAIDKNLDKLDDAFFYILRANVEEARRQNQDDAANALEMIGNVAITKLQQRHGQQPPVEQPQQSQPVEEAPKIHIAGE